MKNAWKLFYCEISRIYLFNLKYSTGLLFIILLLLLIMAILIYRHMSRHKGEYLTQEDKGADDALDPDDAVVHSTTGHHVTKKKEWFI